MKTQQELQGIAYRKWKVYSKRISYGEATSWEAKKAHFWMDVYVNMTRYTFKKAVAESIHNMKNEESVC